MKVRYDPSARGYGQPRPGSGSYRDDPQESPFPGISNPFFGGMNKSMGVNAAVPFEPTHFSNEVPAISIQPASGNVTPLPEQKAIEAVGDKGKGGGLSLPTNLNDLKGLVDRLGGLDGIVSTVGKLQKVVGSITQMAPLIKVLAGSFGKKGGAATIAEDFEDDGLPRPRRRKRRKRSGSTAAGRSRKRRPGGGGGARPRRR